MSPDEAIAELARTHVMTPAMQTVLYEAGLVDYTPLGRKLFTLNEAGRRLFLIEKQKEPTR